MAIQNRRGAYGDFDPSKMVPGEFAVVQSNDPNATDGKSVYLAFAAGDVKRLATHDDMVAEITDITEDIIEEVSAGIEAAIHDDMETASAAAETATQKAADASDSAEEAAQTVATIIDNTLSQSGKAADAQKTGLITAPQYSTSATYNVGDYVIYSGSLYRCTTKISTAESWTSGHWTAAKVGSELSDLKSALASFENYIDGVIPNPSLELGDIYINSSGVLAYYNSTTRVRTARNTSIHLSEGTQIGLSSYDGYRYIVIKSNGDNTYSYVTGWTQADHTVASDGDYLFLFSKVPESAITDANEISELLIIKYDSTFEKLVNGLSGLEEAKNRIDVLDDRKKAIDYINGSNFELGDLYVNGSGTGTYYSSTSRIRTIKDNPVPLNAGDIVGLSDYSNAVYLIRRKISQGQYVYVGGTSWKSVSYLIETDGDYEFLIKYPTEATITDVDAMASLFFIKDKYGIIRESSNIENLTDVFKDELQTTIASARAKTTGRGLMFGVITDTHLDDKRVGYYNQTLENLERLNNGLQFNGIFHLGDIINGYDTADIAKKQLEYAVSRLLKIGGNRTYITVGNHDNNNGAGDAQRLKDYELYSYIQRYDEQYVNRTMPSSDSVYDSPTSNYYVDYPTMKIRMIMFDSCYYSQGFSDDMIAWMTALLASTPQEYNFVLFTHMSTEPELNGGHALGNATTFKNLLAQYKQRIYCYIHGHSHYDYVGYANEFAQIALCCSVPDQPVSDVPVGGVQPSRTVGTVTQECISIVIILPDEQKVEIVRFGAGNDMTVPFRQ